MMKIKALLIALCIIPMCASAQFVWELGGNNGVPPNPVSGTNNILGTSAGTNLPIRIHTGGTPRAEFTTNFALGVNTVIPGIGTGDGLRIMPRTLGCSSVSLPTATLDLWTSCSNGTNIRWDNSGVPNF